MLLPAPAALLLVLALGRVLQLALREGPLRGALPTSALLRAKQLAALVLLGVLVAQTTDSALRHLSDYRIVSAGLQALGAVRRGVPSVLLEHACG